jgi:DNA-binding NarL/FixJ family response regulator
MEPAPLARRSDVADEREPPTAGCRVLVADDSRLYRDGLVDLLSSRMGAGAVAEADSLAAVRTQLAEIEPDVVVVNLASRESADLVAAIADRRPETQVIVVGLDASDERQVIDCAEAGVIGYVTRDYSLADLVAVIDEVTSGGTHIPPAISSLLLRRVREAARQRPKPARLQALSQRETQILRLITAGLSNQDIANELTIELHTVKNHVHSVLTKLGVRRRGEAAALLTGVDRSDQVAVPGPRIPILHPGKMGPTMDPRTHASRGAGRSS